MRIALLLTLFACSHSAVTSTEPNVERNLEATLNGDRLTFATALARARSDGRVEVTASTHQLTCDLLDHKATPDEVRFKLELVPKLLPDGTRSWRVECDEFEAAHECSGDGGAIEATIDTEPGARSRISVTNSQPRKMLSYEQSRTLIVWGQLDAVSCGKKADHWEAPSAQPAFIEVAGNSFPIAGAALADGFAYAPEAGYRLMIGTAPVKCVGPSQDVPVSDLISVGDLKLELAVEPGKAPVAELAGAFIGAPGGSYRSETTGLKFEGLPPSPDARVVEVILGGDAVVSPRKGGAGFAVALRGKVRATVCPKPVMRD